MICATAVKEREYEKDDVYKTHQTTMRLSKLSNNFSTVKLSSAKS